MEVSRNAAAGTPAWRAAAFFGAMIVGAALAHLGMPSIFAAMPLATMRVETVLDALRRRDLSPQIYVFGSSITAAGIHDVKLSGALGGKPLVMNLATPLQGLPEAYLLYQELAASTRVVVQQMTPWELVDPDAFSGTKYNAYHSFGYRPNEHTVAVLSDIFGEKTKRMLRSSQAAETFRQRWVVSRLLDVAFWLNLRMTLYFEALGNDVFFYANNNFRLNEDLVRFLLSQWSTVLSSPNPLAIERKRKLIGVAVDDLRRADRRLVFFVPPIHPYIREHTSPEIWQSFAALLDDARRSGGIVVDLRDMIDDPGFRDALHVKLDVTEGVSRALADGLISAGLFAAPPAPES